MIAASESKPDSFSFLYLSDEAFFQFLPFAVRSSPFSPPPKLRFNHLDPPNFPSCLGLSKAWGPRQLFWSKAGHMRRAPPEAEDELVPGGQSDPSDPPANRFGGSVRKNGTRKYQEIPSQGKRFGDSPQMEFHGRPATDGPGKSRGVQKEKKPLTSLTQLSPN